jgi:hypothetical protein
VGCGQFLHRSVYTGQCFASVIDLADYIRDVRAKGELLGAVMGRLKQICVLDVVSFPSFAANPRQSDRL